MTMNTQPVFPLTPSIQWPTAALLTANTAKDGTGVVSIIFTSDAVNGSRLDFVKLRPLGTNVVTVVRFFINNGLDPTVATNNSLYMERTMLATTISETSEQVDNVVPFGLSLPPGYRVTATVSVTIAAGIRPTGVGGHY